MNKKEKTPSPGVYVVIAKICRMASINIYLATSLSTFTSRRIVIGVLTIFFFSKIKSTKAEKTQSQTTKKRKHLLMKYPNRMRIMYIVMHMWMYVCMSILALFSQYVLRKSIYLVLSIRRKNRRAEVDNAIPYSRVE